MAEAFTELQERVAELTPEALAANEAFVTVTMHASQIAIRNHRKEKIDALRNAVFNAALLNPQHDDEQMIFIRLIDQLTPLHLAVLSLLRDPGAGWIEMELEILDGEWVVCQR